MPSSPSRPDRADPLTPGGAGFAHRGRHGPGVPENSLAAFDAALAMGAGIECDLRLSADGVPLVFHDEDAVRLCGVARRLSATPAADLAGLRLAGTDQPIPTLAQLLARVAGRVPLLLELKDERNAARFGAAVAAALRGYDGPVGVMSFSARVGQWFADHAPQLRRGLVLGDRDAALRRSAKMDRARPHFLAVRLSAVGRPWVAAARAEAPVYCWTVRTPADRARAAPHADALIWEQDGRP